MDDRSFNIRVPKKWVRVSLIVGATALIVAPLTAIASHSFTDVPDSNTFHQDIAWLADAGVTKGCNPPTNTEFCPNDSVSRGQMSAFMRRFAQYIGAEDGTPAQADNATTADSATTAASATTADDADTVDGKDASDLVSKGEANSVSSDMTISESGLASSWQNTNTDISSPAQIDTVTITVPGPGYVVVQAAGYFDIDHINGGGDDRVRAWIDKTAAVGVTFDVFTIANMDSTHATESAGFLPWSIMGVDEVTSAGAVTYYLEADSFLSSGGTNEMGRTHLIAQYFPTNYGDVTDVLSTGGISGSADSPEGDGS